MEPHTPALMPDGFAQCRVKIAKETTINCDLGHGGASHVIDPSFWTENSDDMFAPRDGQPRLRCGVVGPCDLVYTVEFEVIASHAGGLAGFHSNIRFAGVATDYGDTQNKHPDPDMSE